MTSEVMDDSDWDVVVPDMKLYCWICDANINIKCSECGKQLTSQRRCYSAGEQEKVKCSYTCLFSFVMHRIYTS